ncbi:serine/threonine-protein kinase STY17-like [Cucurbita moschata]|uniref:Serine/threonine-protein kinase STY17-like n=1 Tax=Cucurbita moschata TaxID=3662 RepID=A0A6J1GTS5_CUCMO|nr:serine/threonine-protein kinase STY17-like [Cucurbita moschata]
MDSKGNDVELYGLLIMGSDQYPQYILQGGSERPWSEEWEIDFSKLDIQKVVAHGTYRTVFKGTYDNQAVAVKILDWGDGPVLREFFRQRVDVWHKLHHPNVTKFVGASTKARNLQIPSKLSSMDHQSSISPTTCCVVVEYLPGGTLIEFLIRNRKRKLPFKDAIQLALDLSRGLSYLHSNKIMHHDVRTVNMLIDAHRTLKIADIGAARVKAWNPRDMNGKTGTVEYMAPEILKGKPYNITCDVYSFGICLWEIYCCAMPYPNLSFADISSGVVHQNLRPIIPECCPNSLANVMRKCWDGNPSERPAMHEVGEMLEAIDTSQGGGMVSPDQVPRSFCFRPSGSSPGP